ncbi:M20/M25/M40 family metallo-hydrolase [Sorangium sp. So ce1182]|uniref:M20/M25/M40 family metallo-hydrolase n=1 Tax=Sorangium sp. So ce1182 TaxID=3133334 RepID=UPI003F5F8ED0
MNDQRSRFTPEHLEHLLGLLAIDTVSPMETGVPSSIPEAQRAFSDFAASRGFTEALLGAPSAALLTGAHVPVSVREVAARMGGAFLSSQPNLVLRAGADRPAARTLMFNLHMDTVAGHVPVACEDGIVTGRGAVDMKGPGVAVLAGIEAAMRQNPRLAGEIQVLVQSVAGEEGGAMGVYGTKALVDLGYIGRLNVFAEPSEGYFFDRSTTSMTARVSVEGVGSTDDAPHAGQNATVILAAVTMRFARELVADVRRIGGKTCVAGIHTGRMHNRVYGEGALLVNLAYSTMAQAEAIEEATEIRFAEALQGLVNDLADSEVLGATASAARAVTRLEWLKRRLPTLDNRDEAMRRVLAAAGIGRTPPALAHRAFTCDAMWAQCPDGYTVVYGPCSLEHNRAHADGEFIAVADLERFAREVEALVLAFGDHCRSSAALRGEGST